MVAAVSIHPDSIHGDVTKWTSDFDAEIKPIFLNHCQPCHFPGGKMYAKMPFDNPQTIRDHQVGILRRIKDSVDVERIKAFLAK